MRESYIKQVKKALMLSRKKKAEIMRDLQEAFVSASEHGETDQQVLIGWELHKILLPAYTNNLG